ncbi:MAG: DsbA family protein, partial [Gammaproteobacteria bacterium]
MLDQLNDLNREMKAVRSELAQVRNALTEMHRAAVPPPPAAPAQPVPVEITLDNDASLGDPAAKIGIVEFSDFQCPFCLRSHTQTFPRLKESYITNRKLRYVYRDFPLDFHKEAKTAAVAANCAGKQGVYWEMHDALFMNQKRLGAPLYEKLAER